MSDAKRVLTVSYGTFSCTLEGFDDSFGTMTAIAAFFRDLAAEDRHFGAVVPPLEPADPSVGSGMAARDGAQDDAPQDDAPQEEAAPGRPPDAGEAGAADGGHAEPAAVAPPPSERGIAEAGAAPATVSDGTGHAPADDAPADLGRDAWPDGWADPATAVPPEAPAPLAVSPVRMSDTLRRLADAATEASAPDIPDATGEPQQDRAHAADDDEIEQREAGEARREIALPDIGPDAPAPAPPSTPFADGGGAETGSQENTGSDDAAPSETCDETAAGQGAGQGEDAAQASPFQLLRMPRDGADALDGVPSPEAAAPSADTGGDPTPQADTEADSAGPPVDLAVARMLSELDEAAHPEPREDPGDGHGPERGEGLEPDAVLPDTPELETRDAPDAASETALAQADAPVSEEERGDEGDPDLLSAEALEADDMPDTAGEGAPDDAVRGEADGDDPADAPEEDGDPDEVRVSRLIAATNTRLADPGERRRRSAIAHLRAAVAATRADGGDSSERRARAQDASERPYRADLAALQTSHAPSPGGDDADGAGPARDAGAPVTPKRPTPPSAAGTRSERPRAGAEDAAPLMLVSEQRVDEPAEGSVRPRRIRRDEEDAARDDTRGIAPADPASGETGTDGAFAAFAQAQGACALDDLLECAAVYALDRLGQSEVAHPQLWRLVADHVPGWSDLSRETSLRAFGQLQRQGRIRKLRRGAFTVSQASRFRQEARQAAP